MAFNLFFMPRYICTKLLLQNTMICNFFYGNYNNDDVSTIEKTVLQTHFQSVECSSPFYFVFLLLVTTALFLVFLLKSRFTMNYLLIAEPEIYFKFYPVLYVYDDFNIICIFSEILLYIYKML